MSDFSNIYNNLPKTLEKLKEYGDHYEALESDGFDVIKEVKPIGRNEDVISYYIKHSSGNAVSIHINESKSDAMITFFDPESIFNLYKCEKVADFAPGLLRFKRDITVYEVQTTVYQGFDKKYMKIFSNRGENDYIPTVFKNHERLISGAVKNPSNESILAASGTMILKKGKWKVSTGFKTLMQLDSVYADDGLLAAENVFKVIPYVSE